MVDVEDMDCRVQVRGCTWGPQTGAWRRLPAGWFISKGLAKCWDSGRLGA